MKFTESAEDHEKRSIWMDKRNKERLRKRLKCEDVYSRSRTSSPDVYAEILNEYRKSHKNKENNEYGVRKDVEDVDKDVNHKDSLTHHESSDSSDHQELQEDNKSNQTPIENNNESESDDEYGPKPLKLKHSLDMRINYGKELLPGEGDAMAQFVQKGKRIPRRGEVGLTSEEIENFEKIGYVMSGSRHKAINAMRIKKESMVLTAEQERAKAMEKYQARLDRENEIVNNLKEMLRKKYEESENIND